MCGLVLLKRKFVRRSGLLTGLATGHKARGVAHVLEHGVLEKMISRYQAVFERVIAWYKKLKHKIVR